MGNRRYSRLRCGGSLAWLVGDRQSRRRSRLGSRFRLVLLQERECGLIGRMPSVCAPVRMQSAVGKIRPLDGAGDLARRSGGACDVGDAREIVLGRSTITIPGQQPQRPQLFVGEPTGQQLLLRNRGILQDVMKPGHRSGKDRRGLGDPPDVKEHRRAACFEGPSECALGDSSCAFDSHARCRHFVTRDRHRANRPDALLATVLCRHSFVDAPTWGPKRLAPFSGFSPGWEPYTRTEGPLLSMQSSSGPSRDEPTVTPGQALGLAQFGR